MGKQAMGKISFLNLVVNTWIKDLSLILTSLVLNVWLRQAVLVPECFYPQGLQVPLVYSLCNRQDLSVLTSLVKQEDM